MKKAMYPFADDIPVLQLEGLAYSYPGQPRISFPGFTCQKGQHTLISGQSGVGKTTLLHLISGLQAIQSGDVRIGGHSLKAMSSVARDRFRGKYIGLVFQQPRFVTSLNTLDNVLAAQHFGIGHSDRRKAMSLLGELGIEGKSRKSTQTLSGGERQRLAIARALAAGAALVLADEPTSSLDDVNAQAVYDLLMSEMKTNDATLIVVSHDARLISKFDNRIAL